MELNIQNKNALVCGSTQGIGKAIALQLAFLGANVTLMARNETTLNQICSEELPLLHTTQKHGYIVANFANPDSMTKSVESYLQNEKISFDILINNTGGPPAGSVFNATPIQFLEAYNNHLICNHLLSQALVPAMKKNGFGRIINIISTSVKEPIENLGVSNTTRAAVAAWAKTLATELAPFGITVNNVLPGFTQTQRLEQIIKNRATQMERNLQDTEKELINVVPMKRFASPTEIANAVIFLASEAASYITGINLPVDGGRTKSL